MDLQDQFARLQQQQQQKLEKRRKKKEKSEKENKTDASIAFGINDDLGLKLAEEPTRNDGAYSEELVNHLNDQIRELKDETGRLYKLLSERDMELRQMKKKREQEKNLMNAAGPVAADGAASKIVELSKKVRELSAELESEKSRSKQWAKKCFDLENQVSVNTLSANSMLRSGTVPPSAVSRKSVNDPNELQQLGSLQEAEIKVLQDKLKQSEQKSAEFRNQCQSLRQELKVAQKVLANEVGDGVTVQSLLNSPSGWRGRAQQILALQKKVNELKGQVESMQSVSRMSDADLEAQFMGSASSRRTMTTMDERHRDQLRKVEKERKDAQERMANEFKALEADFESTKNKLDASRARNKVLTTEVKALKQQMATVLEKGRHDDELIAALMKQQANLKEMLDKTSKQQDSVQRQKEEKEKELQIRQQQDNNIVAQMQAIVADKEAKVKQLEEEIKQCKLNNLQKAQMNGVTALFERAASRTGSAMSSARPGSSAQVMEDGTVYSNASPISSAKGQRSSSRQNFVQPDGESVKRPSSRRAMSRQNSELATSNTINDSRPAGASQEELEELQLQIHEIRAMYQATEVERDRLSELVRVLEKRVEDATGNIMEAQNELQTQKRRNVLLEKQLGKIRVEQGAASSKPGTAVGRKGTSKARGSAANLNQAVSSELTEDPSAGAASVEELHTTLSIQKDEYEALKAALQRTLKAKEEDLRLYNEIMDETKKVFLHGLRQYRQGQNQ